MRLGVVDLDKGAATSSVATSIKCTSTRRTTGAEYREHAPDADGLCCGSPPGAREVPSAAGVPIALARPSDAITMGWGSSGYSVGPDGTPLYEQRSYALRQTLDVTDCEDVMCGDIRCITDRMMCEDADARRGPVSGDSGGRSW